MAISGSDDISEKLARMGREAEEREAERLAGSLGIPYVGALPGIQLEALKLIKEPVAREAKTAAVKIEKKEVTVVIAEPKNPKTAEELKKLKDLGYSPVIYIVSKSTLTKALEHYKEIIEAAPEITSKIDISEADFIAWSDKFKSLKDVEDFFDSMSSSGAGELSTTQVLSIIFAASIFIDVSDIHFEAAKDEAVLRFRVDGILHTVAKFPNAFYKQIISRVKLLAGLKINITDTPQDGRFTIRINSDSIETRVAVSPSEFGEAIVMRVLNPKSIALTLSQLGLRKDDEEIALKEIKRPNGMILVTGPTGSGKTTTLYAFLKNVADSETKIITIEDPIEYHLAGVQQTQVDPGAGYTFASGLRSILRQDPDMLLVGEIRDGETADIAVNASLTGHLVFSTLHTNNSIGAIPRLIDLGVKNSLIGPALSLIIAQRLVRRLCPNCKKEAPISEEVKKKISEFKKQLPQKIKFYGEEKIYEANSPAGCEKCNGGYKGRVGIYEFLSLGGEFEALINKDATEFAIKELAKKHGFIEMQADGILKVLGGITSFEEVEKTTGPLEW